MRWLHLLVWVYMNSERLWVTVDFLLFEVHNQNWNREKKLCDHSCSFLFCRWQKHNHRHCSIFHLQSSAVTFHLQRSVFSLQHLFFSCIASLNLANLSKSRHIISVFCLWAVTPTRLGFAVTTSSSLDSFNFTLVCRFLFSDRLSSSVYHHLVIPVVPDKEGTHWHTNTHWTNLTHLKVRKTQIQLHKPWQQESHLCGGKMTDATVDSFNQ